MKLNRHYTITNQKYVHRKLFLCRNCGKPCKPSKYVVFPRNKRYMIAQSYGCLPCDVNYKVS